MRSGLHPQNGPEKQAVYALSNSLGFGEAERRPSLETLGGIDHERTDFHPDSIRDLIELVFEKHLSSFKIEQGTFKLEIQGEQRAKQPRFRRLLGLCPFPRKFRKGAPQKPAGREVKAPL